MPLGTSGTLGLADLLLETDLERSMFVSLFELGESRPSRSSKDRCCFTTGAGELGDNRPFNTGLLLPTSASFLIVDGKVTVFGSRVIRLSDLCGGLARRTFETGPFGGVEDELGGAWFAVDGD